MATSDSPQIEELVDTLKQTKGNHHLCKDQQREEQVPLLPKAKVKRKLKRRTRCCLKSKAALLILYWNMSIITLVAIFTDPGTYISFFAALDLPYGIKTIILVIYYSLAALLFIFFPLAGCLADIKCGRYKTVTRSLWIVFFTELILLVCAGVFLEISTHVNRGTFFLILIPILTFNALIELVTLFPSYISFSANVIQFGMDQLHDSPTEDSVLFIHWFVFSSSIGFALIKTIAFIVQNTFEVVYEGFEMIIAALLANIPVMILLGVSLCIARWKRQWFLIDSASRNPYKLVYKVIRFAAQHKIPIRRSAFTYCEDELPSRMDLGKDKYGGPFTTEQVEDVKAFLGILSVLLTFGPIFTIDIAIYSMLPDVSLHLQSNISTSDIKYFKLGQNNYFTEILIATFIPVYICLLRPYIQHCIPGMLKRIGLGMAMLLLSSVTILTIDAYGHIHTSNNVCFFNSDHHAYYSIISEPDTLNISIHYLMFPYVLTALGYTLFNIAAYEFICSQSPHAMKGLLIGMFFAVKGVFQLIGATVVLVPFNFWHFNFSFPSCGFVYYLINVVIALTGLVAYTCVARRYQYRQRDEPDNTYRYAEDYYDRDRDDSYQSSYDYSNDHDNLNVHSIK